MKSRIAGPGSIGRSMPEGVPAAFIRVLTDLTAWFADAHVSAMVVGGVAVSILGRPRATRDIDVLTTLSDDRWAEALSSAARHGIAARVASPLEFARRTRVLLLRHEESGIDVDIILGGFPTKGKQSGAAGCTISAGRR